MTLGEHLMMADSAMFYIANVQYNNKTNMKVAEPAMQTLKYIKIQLAFE